MKRIVCFTACLLLWCGSMWAERTPKREFRGTWLHTVGNEYYRNLTPAQWKDTLCKQLDAYQAAGINVIIFQVRPEGDAFYRSDIEPWSRYLTGEQGLPPEPLFDPMDFLIEECHKRCMEFHAWLNPYRALADSRNVLCSEHLYFQKRYRFVSYGNQMFFNPGLPENREHICRVVRDIVHRYDVDAVHLDDYFYPYPLKGLKFPDDAAFRKYGIPAGYTPETRNDWRRDNVNRLIHELSNTIRVEKPWVRFGISPFGIYRNKRQDTEGSDTNGLSNYDELYADILLWMQEGWIDYCVPQLYWNIGFKVADYAVLATWWAKHTPENVKLYIGEDVARTALEHQLHAKMALDDSLSAIQGHCYWSGKILLTNPSGYKDSLQYDYHSKPALLPLYSDKDSIAPDAPWDVHLTMEGVVPTLHWKPANEFSESNTPRFFAVYAFELDEPVDVSRADKLQGFTVNTQLALPYNDGKVLCKRYVVTAIDRLHNESKPSAPFVWDKEDEEEE